MRKPKLRGRSAARMRGPSSARSLFRSRASTAGGFACYSQRHPVGTERERGILTVDQAVGSLQMGGGVDYRHRGSDAGDSRDVLSVRAYREAGERGWYFESRSFLAGGDIHHSTIRNTVRPTVCNGEIARIRTKCDRADVRRFGKWDLAARNVLKRQHAP